jgi:hypothetical protein
LFPGTVGPDAGNGFALAEDTITASTAALTKIFELTEGTERFRSVSYATRIPFEKKKMRSLRIFPKTFTTRSHDTSCGGAYVLKGRTVGKNFVDDHSENRMSSFANAARLSRPIWTNIVFVALASLSGLSDGPSSSGRSATDSQFAAQPNSGPSNLTPTSDSSVPTNEPATPPGPVVPALPIIVPPVFPPPPPPSVLDDLNAILNGTASGAHEVAESDLQAVCPVWDLAERLQAV